MPHPATLSAEMVAAAAKALRFEIVESAPAQTIFAPGAAAPQQFASALHTLGVQATVTPEGVVIPHDGHFLFAREIATIAAIEQAHAIVCRPQHVEFGHALRAAQEVFARANAGG